MSYLDLWCLEYLLAVLFYFFVAKSFEFDKTTDETFDYLQLVTHVRKENNVYTFYIRYMITNVSLLTVSQYVLKVKLPERIIWTKCAGLACDSCRWEVLVLVITLIAVAASCPTSCSTLVIDPHVVLVLAYNSLLSSIVSFSLRLIDFPGRTTCKRKQKAFKQIIREQNNVYLYWARRTKCINSL